MTSRPLAAVTAGSGLPEPICQGAQRRFGMTVPPPSRLLHASLDYISVKEIF